jgi:hypothetical protein
MNRYRHFRRCGLLWALTLVCVAVVAEDPRPEKMPWEWTVDERLAARSTVEKNGGEDRELALEKGDADRLESADPSAGADGRMIRYRIDGSRNPELFFPHELFDGLVSSAEGDAGAIANRNLLREGIARAGFEPLSFWDDLAMLTRDYRILREVAPRSPLDSSRGEWKSEKQSSAIRLCQLRMEVLNAARSHFGSDAFDRLLYTVMAPHSRYSYAGTASETSSTGRLKAEATGCK